MIERGDKYLTRIVNFLRSLLLFPRTIFQTGRGKLNNFTLSIMRFGHLICSELACSSEESKCFLTIPARKLPTSLIIGKHSG